MRPRRPDAAAKGLSGRSTGWTATADVISSHPNQPAHTGTTKAWLSGYGETHTDRLSQPVTLTATAAAVSPTFFLHTTTEEQTTTQAFDKLRVPVRAANGTITTLKTFSKLQVAPGSRCRRSTSRRSRAGDLHSARSCREQRVADEFRRG